MVSAGLERVVSAGFLVLSVSLSQFGIVCMSQVVSGGLWWCPLIFHIISWFPLITAGLQWSLLGFGGICRCLLVSNTLCWFRVVFPGLHWPPVLLSGFQLFMLVSVGLQ